MWSAFPAFVQNHPAIRKIGRRIKESSQSNCANWGSRPPGLVANDGLHHSDETRLTELDASRLRRKPTPEEVERGRKADEASRRLADQLQATVDSWTR